jgi:hypothetical protein
VMDTDSGSMPVVVNLGLNVVGRSSGLFTSIKEPTHGRIIYSSIVSPFKFAVEPSSAGKKVRFGDKLEKIGRYQNKYEKN